MSKLTEEINEVTERLNNSLNPSGYAVKIGHRNGYTAIDQYKYPEGSMITYLDAGLTARQCLNTLYAMCKAAEMVTNPRKPVIEVDNMANFEFWLSSFRPRSDKWKRDTLKRLKADIHTFGTLDETNDKIKALKFLLNI